MLLKSWWMAAPSLRSRGSRPSGRFACGAVCPPLRGGRSWRVPRERQGGQGLVSRSHARLNPRLDGLVRRACAENCLVRTRLDRARGPPPNAHMPATPATDREPSPRPPCRGYLVCLGRVSVSRPIEGLDSLRASRTLRTLDLRANGSASRLRAGVRCCVLHPATRPPGHPATRPPGHPATRPPGHPAWDESRCQAKRQDLIPRALLRDSTPDPAPSLFSRAQCTRQSIARIPRTRSVRGAGGCPSHPQRADGAEAVEPLDGARHATSSQTNQVAAAGWAGAWLAVRCRRGGHVRVGWRVPGAAPRHQGPGNFWRTPAEPSRQAQVQPRM